MVNAINKALFPGGGTALGGGALRWVPWEQNSGFGLPNMIATASQGFEATANLAVDFCNKKIRGGRKSDGKNIGEKLKWVKKKHRRKTEYRISPTDQT